MYVHSYYNYTLYVTIKNQITIGTKCVNDK